jgi:4-amino-4-deoxy-L-arabinose transferase-like glycosyltransferase
MKQRDLFFWVILLLFSLTGVFGRSLWGSNETRGAGMILDMARHHSYVAPTLNGKLDLEKPPFLHWLALFFGWLFGGVSEGTVRLPAALSGLATLVLMQRWVASWESEQNPQSGRAAWAAVFLCATSATFFEYSRVVMSDLPLTLWVTLSLWLFWKAERCESSRATRWLPFLSSCAAAFFAKGLIGPGLIWFSVGAYLLATRRPLLLLKLGLAFTPLFLLFLYPWVAALAARGGPEAVRIALWDNQAGRFLSFRDPNLPADPFLIHKEPLSYYASNLPVALAPWTLVAAAAMLALFRPRRLFGNPDRFPLFLASSLFGMLFVLHVSAAKVGVYALPLFPFVFMAAGIWLAGISRVTAKPWERIAAGISFGAVAAALVLAPVAAIVLAFRKPPLAPGLSPAPAFLVPAGACVAAAILAGILALRAYRRRGFEAVCLFPAGLALLLIPLLLFALKVLEPQRSLIPAARLAAEQIRAGRELALGTRRKGVVGGFTFYLDRRVPVLRESEDVAGFLFLDRPRAAVVDREWQGELEPLLENIPHDVLSAGPPGSTSEKFLVLRNRPERSPSPSARK